MKLNLQILGEQCEHLEMLLSHPTAPNDLINTNIFGQP